MSSLYFQICSLFYIILLTGVFFLKKRLSTVENKIFSYMIITNLVGVILDIISTYLAIIDANYVLLIFFCKLYLVYLMVWITLMTAYIFSISNIFGNNENARNNTFLILTIMNILSIVCVMVLPLYSNRDNGSIYTYGPSATTSYAISGICIVIWLVCMIKNYKNLKSKKYLPMFAYMTIGLMATAIQMIKPEVLVITSMETFITVLMYFTIQNPDLKMIEQLNIARDQADKANRAKSDFLSSMSHEIRTPLNAIVGFSNSLKDSEGLSEQAKADVKDILVASDTLLEIVNGILDISKIEANKIEIIDKEYDAYKMFDELSKLTKVRIGEKPIEFITKIDETIPRVLYGDQVRVKQIVLNLLTNAAKYTDEGKIIFKADSVITGNIVRLIISVEDTGRGIKKESIDKLFTKFQRLDEDRNTTIEGTGLGLAITKKLVELMHGNIVVESDYGKGSKFTVSIDQSIVKNPTIKLEDDNTDTKEVLNLKGKKVLIVDDNKLNIKVATRLLSKYNLTIESVTSGFEAIDLINSKNTYDLILLDDMMPKMNGKETLNKLKEIEGFNIPVVALTANVLTGMKEKYLKAGFNDYLAKPIELNELTRVLKLYLKNVK